ncbi:uncharacterized protein LACBIDRAFT_329250 [Laccaria bicolor S238N-H82]|uniref:Predicted protein n=1 Tax=Laccaria bicolor (strain S238N-H82 / ATCC MYA-4686) TaxID=486041 RepID=B0DHH9_LACBS|nr:uncharacterized protein LACBIDRAFT_329250 [Laccaria bicolor S238N-H82]EDR06106.1 predicted protein [Laccaria bicolor S238N-H82]|eukprot:XP_001883394.1 predicted protein [Laccaria bicolor S238N-H82]
MAAREGISGVFRGSVQACSTEARGQVSGRLGQVSPVNLTGPAKSRPEKRIRAPKSAHLQSAPPRSTSSSNNINPFRLQSTPEMPLYQLTRHWLNERHAPDILPVQEPLSHLRRQSEAVHLLPGDPSSSDKEHIRIMLVQTEIERVKFIMMSIRGCSR